MQACHGEVWFPGQRIGEASNPGPPRRRNQFSTPEPLVRCGRFVVLSSTSDDEACAVAVKCPSECEDHSRVAVRPDVESREFKRLHPSVTDVLGSQQFKTSAHRGGLL